MATSLNMFGDFSIIINSLFTKLIDNILDLKAINGKLFLQYSHLKFLFFHAVFDFLILLTWETILELNMVHII